MWQPLSMIINTSQIYTLKDNLFSIFSVRTYFPSSQFVLFRFCLILKRLKFFIFSQRTDATYFRIKMKRMGAAKRKNAGRVTNCGTLKARSVEEEHWQRQRDKRPLLQYTKLWSSKKGKQHFPHLLLPLLHKLPNLNKQRFVFCYFCVPLEKSGRCGGVRAAWFDLAISWDVHDRSHIMRWLQCHLGEQHTGGTRSKRKMQMKVLSLKKKALPLWWGFSEMYEVRVWETSRMLLSTFSILLLLPANTSVSPHCAGQLLRGDVMFNEQSADLHQSSRMRWNL